MRNDDDDEDDDIGPGNGSGVVFDAGALTGHVIYQTASLATTSGDPQQQFETPETSPGQYAGTTRTALYPVTMPATELHSRDTRSKEKLHIFICPSLLWGNDRLNVKVVIYSALYLISLNQLHLPGCLNSS